MGNWVRQLRQEKLGESLKASAMTPDQLRIQEPENRGLGVILANAREPRFLPGRKTDVNDAQWIQQLHACGLLLASFHPELSIAILRRYLRTRERMFDYAAAYNQHMQNALTHMNIQLHHVISDLTGSTDMKIIRAIVDGKHSPAESAAMRDVRCKSDVSSICKALTGNYEAEHLFALQQALYLYDAYQVQIHVCDAEIQKTLVLLSLDSPVPDKPLPKARHSTKLPNAKNFDVRQPLYHSTCIDLTQIHGIGPYRALRMISVCGTDMKKWPTDKHFSSWLNLPPDSKIKCDNVLSAHTRKRNRGTIVHLRLAATTLGRTNTALGALYRRLSARIGKAKAVTATTRIIAVLFYNAMRYGMDYQDPGADQYEQQYRVREIKKLRRMAAVIGFTLECVS